MVRRIYTTIVQETPKPKGKLRAPKPRVMARPQRTCVVKMNAFLRNANLATWTEYQTSLKKLRAKKPVQAFIIQMRMAYRMRRKGISREAMK